MRSFFWSVFFCTQPECRDLLSVFSPGTGKYGPEKTLYLGTFHTVEHLLMAESDFFYLLVEYSQRLKCLDRRSNMTKSGAAATTLSTCNYFNQMLYLIERVVNQPTESNQEYMVSECQVSPSIEYKDVNETSFLEPLLSTISNKKAQIKYFK